MIYSVYSTPPPDPDRYPATIAFVNACGGKVVAVIRTASQWHFFRFWYWSAAPLGHSQLSPTLKDPDGGDAVVN